MPTGGSCSASRPNTSIALDRTPCSSSDSVAVDLGPPHADQRFFPLNSLVGLQVLTEGGEQVGHIADAELDAQTLEVTSYLLKETRGVWRRRGRVHPDDVVTFSPELMIVRNRQPKAP